MPEPPEGLFSIDEVSDRDPQTINRNQAAVWRCLREHGPATDVALVPLYEASMAADPEHFPVQSPSGIRTRRAELTEKGRVVATGGRVKLDSGRWADEWAATE